MTRTTAKHIWRLFYRVPIILVLSLLLYHCHADNRSIQSDRNEIWTVVIEVPEEKQQDFVKELNAFAVAYAFAIRISPSASDKDVQEIAMYRGGTEILGDNALRRNEYHFTAYRTVLDQAWVFFYWLLKHYLKNHFDGAGFKTQAD